MDNKEIARLAGICSTLYSPLLQKPNTIGMGVGFKYRNGKDTGRLCLQVYVSKKLPSAFLANGGIIPQTYYDVPTDVIETGIFSSFSEPFASRRPTECGCSIGLSDVPSAGTAGALVEDASGRRYILSNNHVLGNQNAARAGDMVIQPALLDGGIGPRDAIARLTRYVPIKFLRSDKVTDLSPTNTVDGAIAQFMDEGLMSPRIRNIGAIQPPVAAQLDLPVKKSGRTTGLTHGKITAINATILVSYAKGSALFLNQIVSTPMAEPGDSGSLLVDEHNRAVGLLFAGSDSETLFNPISSVLSELRVSLVTSG